MAKVEINIEHMEKLQKEIVKACKQRVKVGILAGATYPNGTKVSEVAAYLENGWTQTVTDKQRGWLGVHGVHVKKNTTLSSPARPFFAVTAEVNRKKWNDIGFRALKGLANNPNALNQITQALMLLGMTAQQDLQDAVIDGSMGGASFAIRSPMTMLLYGNLMAEGGHKTDDTPNQTTSRKPLYKTGILASSIAFEIEKK